MSPLLQLLLAAALGLLVGLQRESDHDPVAGIRTMALITIFGALCGQVSQIWGGWVFASGILGIVVLFVLGHWVLIQQSSATAGITGEVAGVVMFGVGGLIAIGHVSEALVTAGLASVLLFSKTSLHNVVNRIGAEELRAFARLVLIALVILPVVPDQAIGPYAVINPFRIWLMVVIIVGISLAAWLISQWIGPKKGLWVTGLLGGLISSTATAAAVSAQVKRKEFPTRGAGVVIFISSAIVFIRVILEIAITAPDFFWKMVPPAFLVFVWMALLAALLFRKSSHGEEEISAGAVPKDLGAAVIFALLYALVLLAVAWTQATFDAAGLYVVAGLSGLTDMDAITLSTSQLVQQGTLPPATGWRLILVGGLANLVFKFILVLSLGGRSLGRVVALPFLLTILAGVALLIWWP